MVCKRIWPADEKRRLKELFYAGLVPADMARQMNISVDAVYAQCKRMGLSFRERSKLEKAVVDKVADPEMRPCLKCRHDFKSTWIGNRICPECKESNAGYVGVVYG
jgi:hypothetical protein